MAFFLSTQRLLSAPPFARRLLLIGIDSLLLPLSVWLSFWFRLAHPFHSGFVSASGWLLLSVLLVGLPLYLFTGQYKGLTRYVGSAALYRLAGRNGLLVLLLCLIGMVLRLPMPPVVAGSCFGLLLTAFSVDWHCVTFYCNSFHTAKQIPASLFTVRATGAQLAAALRLAGNHLIVTFLDDNPLIGPALLTALLFNPSSFDRTRRIS